MTAANTVEQQLETLRTGAGIFPLTDRAFLRITGPDATRWLNGMVTNSIQSLQPGEGNYNFLLNAQGRIQGDCTIYREPGDGEPTYLLVTDAAQAESIHQILDKFIIMDDVELTPEFTDQTSVRIFGATAETTLQRLALPAIDPLHLAHADTPHGPVLLSRPSASYFRAFDLCAPPATLNGLRSATQLPEVSAEIIDALRVLSATPKFGQDIRDKDLPQETAQTHALHFNKGCYLGQEIVERIRSRGQVHRTFTSFILSGDLPTLPAPLEANGKSAGELTSAIRIGDQIHALGYARREFLETHATLTYAGGTAAPKSPR